jgi:P pilus assembly chaperone PapD
MRVSGSFITMSRFHTKRPPMWRLCICALLIAVRLPAQAASVSPQAVVMSDRAPSGALTVLNPNDGPIEVSLSLRFGWVETDSATGRTVVRLTDDSLSRGNSAVSIVRFAPSRFRLAAGTAQVVRFVAVPGASLPEGEYWARVLVSAKAADGGLPSGETGVAATGKVNIEVQTVLPVFFRKGRVQTGLSADVGSAEWHGDTITVRPTFTRLGTGVALGALRLEALDHRDRVLASANRQLAVYRALSPSFELPVAPEDAARVTSIRLTVTSQRPDLPEALPLPFPSVVQRVPVPPRPSPSDLGIVQPRRSSGGPSADDDPWWIPTIEGSERIAGLDTLSRANLAPATDSVPARLRPNRDTTTARDSLAVIPDAMGILAVVYNDDELGTVFTRVGATQERPQIPLRQFASLLGIQIGTAASTNTIELRVPTFRAIEATYEPRSGRATRRAFGGRTETQEFPADTVGPDGGEHFLDLAPLEWITGIALQLDVASASLLLVAERSSIPRFASAIARAERRRATAEESWPSVRSSGERLIHGGWLPDGISTTYTHNFDNQSGDYASQATIGTTVLGGGLLADVRATRFGNFEHRHAEVGWIGGNPMNRFIRQVRLGSGTSTGLTPLAGRGIALTNAPFLRSRQLGSMTRSGTAPPGAEIELSRNGQVLGVTVADSAGNWVLPVPIDFGQNALELAIYTPDGVSRRATLLSLESDLIPARSVEYGLTIQDNDTPESDCRRRLGQCGLVSNVDLRVGLTSRYTARIGAYELRPRDGSPAQRLPYASVVGSPTDWLQVRGEGAQRGWWRGRAVVQPSLRLRVEVGSEAVDPQQPPFWMSTLSQSFRRETSGAITVRPLSRDLGKAWFSAQWRRAESQRGSAAVLTTTAGVRFARTLVQATYDRIEAQSPVVPRFISGRPGATVTVPQITQGPRWLRRTFASISTRFTERRQVELVSSQLSTNVSRGIFLQGGVDWVRNGGSSMRMQLQYQGRMATFFQDVVGGMTGRARSTTSVMGSATMSRRGMQLDGDVVALRARVSGVAYEDRNHNGRFDPDEPRLADVPVRVGGQSVRTDHLGRYIVTGLPVLDAMAVQADVDSFLAQDGRILMTGQSRQWAMLAPFGDTRIDLAFVDETTRPGRRGDDAALAVPPSRREGPSAAFESSRQ